MALNARQLEVFRAVMRSGSLTSAAKALNVSQPAASKVLRYTETQLGYTLFERIGSRLVPTAEAHILFPEADRVFKEIEAIRDLSDRIRENKEGLLRIGASVPPTFAVVPDAIAAFRANGRQHVKIVLRTLPMEQLSEELFHGELDFALTLSASPHASIDSELLRTVDVVAVMREDCDLAARSVITGADLADQDVISYGPRAEAGVLLDRAFARQNLVRRVGLEVTVALSAVPLIQAGFGVALLDGMFPWADFPGLTTRPFSPQTLMGLHLLTNRNRPLQRLAREFIELIPHLPQGPSGAGG